MSSADIALKKEDTELIPLVLDVAQKRQPSGRWGVLLQKFRASELCDESSRGDGADDAEQPGQRDVMSNSGQDASDVEIQWQGPEPVLVRTASTRPRNTDDLCNSR